MMRCKGMCTGLLDKLACVDGGRVMRDGRRHPIPIRIGVVPS